MGIFWKFKSARWAKSFFIDFEQVKPEMIEKLNTKLDARKEKIFQQLSEGQLTKFLEKPGKEYIVFKDSSDCEKAINELRNSDYSDSFRKANYPNSIEIYPVLSNLIREKTGKQEAKKAEATVEIKQDEKQNYRPGG